MDNTGVKARMAMARDEGSSSNAGTPKFDSLRVGELWALADARGLSDKGNKSQLNKRQLVALLTEDTLNKQRQAQERTNRDGIERRLYDDRWLTKQEAKDLKDNIEIFTSKQWHLAPKLSPEREGGKSIRKRKKNQRRKTKRRRR